MPNMTWKICTHLYHSSAIRRPILSVCTLNDDNTTRIVIILELGIAGMATELAVVSTLKSTIFKAVVYILSENGQFEEISGLC